MNRAALVAVGTSVAAAGVVFSVWQQKQQFYPTVVHISKSSSCMAVFYIQAFALVYLFAHLFRKMFFGSLRTAETEHLIERSWYALTETCLAFTVFRDDLSPTFVAQFALLLFLKAFHWLLEDRIDFMERSPILGFLFHFRALSLMGILAVCDGFLLSYAAHVTLQRGATVHLVFGFEYVVLILLVTTILVKYVLHLIDLRHENQWANKTIYLLYTELLIGAIKVLMYAMFVTIMIRVHTFPLFVVRPMYNALREFQKTLIDVVKSRKATHNMRELYPDATPEEIASGDNTCIICREEMLAAKKLPCGHIFHLECLRSWLLRQQTCPTCRIDILQQQQQQRQQQRAQQRGAGNEPPPAQGGAAAGAQPAPPPPIFTWINRNNNNPNNNNNNNPPNANGGAQGGGGGGSGSSRSSRQGSARFFIPAGSGAPNPNMAAFAMPPPPPSLHSLTDEELRVFEGSTRQAVENRLVILRNIQMLMEAIQGQMQLYHSVAGPLHIPNMPTAAAPGTSQQPPTAAATDAAPAPTLSTSSTDAQASELGDEDETPFKITVDGKEMVFGSKDEYEEALERNRDTLLRDWNLIAESDFQAGERAREQMRAQRLARLATKRATAAAAAAEEQPSSSGVQDTTPSAPPAAVADEGESSGTLRKRTTQTHEE